MVSIDWLSFSVLAVKTADERQAGVLNLRTPKGCSIVTLSGTNIFHRRAYVLDSVGDKVLTLLWEPFSRVLNPDIVFVEVANKWLYSSLDWLDDFLWEIHHYQFLSLSRLDLACDFSPDAEQWSIIEKLSDGRAYIQGKKEQCMFSMVDFSGRRVKRVPKQISWGSKTSNIGWKLYNKTLEIHEEGKDGELICNKPYIKERWVEEGLNVDNVWRLEVSITSAAKYKFEGEPLGFQNSRDFNFYTRLFESLYATRFVSRLNEGHKDRSNDTRVWLFDLGSIPNRLKLKEPKDSAVAIELASTLRMVLDKIQQPSVISNPAILDAMSNTARQLMQLKQLRKWFFNKYHCEFDEWLARESAITLLNT